MAGRFKIKKSGVTVTFWEQSFRVRGVPQTIWIGKRIGRTEAEQIADALQGVFNLGKKAMMRELKGVLNEPQDRRSSSSW